MEEEEGHSPNGLTDFDKGAGVLDEQLIPLPRANPARTTINLPAAKGGKVGKRISPLLDAAPILMTEKRVERT